MILTEQPTAPTAETVLETNETNEPFIIHNIKRGHDSLTSIALRYGVSIDSIKVTNGIIANDLDFVKQDQLIIPNPKYKGLHVKPDLDEILAFTQRKKHLVASAFASNHKITVEEAIYYLENNDYSFEQAAQELEEDQEWEASQKKQGNKFSGPSDRAPMLNQNLTRRHNHSNIEMRPFAN